MIEGVIEKPLKIIEDDRGAVLHMLRKSDFDFEQLGEVYFSQINKDVLKGWYRHATKVNHFAVPVGEIKLVLYDGRENSNTATEIYELTIGRHNYSLVRIPSMVWYSFKGLSQPYSLITNCTTEVYDEKSSFRLEIDTPEIPYQWI